jgi:hypothetical protein
MQRINLLPREVLDRHRFEGWYRYVFIITTGLALLVLLAAAGLLLLVQQRSDELQTQRDKAAQYAEQGKTFDIFERKEKELADRQALVQAALVDRINMGKVAEELSMILPDEVWLDSLTLDQTSGMSFVANTPRSSSHSLDVAYKSVAKTLVRVNEMPEVADVWLSNASNASWVGWQGSTVDTTTPVVQFTTLAKILTPQEVPPKATLSR